VDPKVDPNLVPREEKVPREARAFSEAKDPRARTEANLAPNLDLSLEDGARMEANPARSLEDGARTEANPARSLADGAWMEANQAPSLEPRDPRATTTILMERPARVA